ncbi:hypothetical protein BGHDH14_bgh01205 [Blumeria hordei DH14]|uniref:Late endosomal/lysosomal adaptor and MAPK and MTOR activator 1 n=1 Tax=Blumeria graminis f. sp. hordei (strain DH14) TaxID=546991 RepID=N1J6P5_BLUG1|nr:hypothetical protein BGHDH14_bgh01205 [Blumeria hordei DH14]
MGICFSCLGYVRDEDFPEENDHSQLLYNGTHGQLYGSFGDISSDSLYEDPIEVQRANEALQNIVSQTSEHLVDIFAITPQDLPLSIPTIHFPAREAQLSQFRNIISKLPLEEPSNGSYNNVVNSQPCSYDAWMSDEENDEKSENYPTVKLKGIGSLLGRFADYDSVNP